MVKQRILYIINYNIVLSINQNTYIFTVLEQLYFHILRKEIQLKDNDPNDADRGTNIHERSVGGNFKYQSIQNSEIVFSGGDSLCRNENIDFFLGLHMLFIYVIIVLSLI